MTQVEIFSAEVCPYAHRTRLVLLEKNINFKLTEINLKKKPSWFNKVSPYGKVPVLKHEEKLIYESSIINEYLDDVFSVPSLMPSTPYDRALARIWIDYGNSYFNSTIYKLLRENKKDEQIKLRKKLGEIFIYIENNAFAKFDNYGFWMGDRLTLVDLSYYHFFERLCNIEHFRSFKIPRECKRLLYWVELMQEQNHVKSISNSKEFYIRRASAYVTA